MRRLGLLSRYRDPVLVAPFQYSICATKFGGVCVPRNLYSFTWLSGKPPRSSLTHTLSQSFCDPQCLVSTAVIHSVQQYKYLAPSNSFLLFFFLFFFVSLKLEKYHLYFTTETVIHLTNSQIHIHIRTWTSNSHRHQQSLKGPTVLSPIPVSPFCSRWVKFDDCSCAVLTVSVQASASRESRACLSQDGTSSPGRNLGSPSSLTRGISRGGSFGMAALLTWSTWA